MNLSCLSGIVVAATLVAGTAFGQTEQGRKELSLSGAYSAAWLSADYAELNTRVTHVYVGTLGVGYFVTDALEAKVNLSVVGASAGTLADIYVIPITLGLDYHFNTKKTAVPYLGAAVGVYAIGGGFADVSQTLGAAMANVHVGLKYFATKRAAFDCQVGYEYIPLPVVTLNSTFVTVGIGVYF